jgi:alpha-glucoside transport system substrate-binding protein
MQALNRVNEPAADRLPAIRRPSMVSALVPLGARRLQDTIRRRRLLRIGMSLLIVLGTASCVGGHSGGGDHQKNLADLDRKTVTVAAGWSGVEQENFQKVLDLFKEATGINITYTATGVDKAAFLNGRIASGNPPDVALLPNPGLMTELARDGLLKPLDDAVARAIDTNYRPIWRQLGTVDGKLYGVWFKAANKSTIWYNVQALEAAGVEAPRTWDEFKKAIRTINASGTPAIAVGGSDAWTLTDWFENIYLRTAGPEKYDQLAKHEIPWTHESVKQALATMGEVLTEQNLAGGVEGALSTDFQASVRQVFADPPKAAMVYEGDFVAGVIAGQTTAELGEQADFFDFPSISGRNETIMGGGDVAVLLKDSPGGRALVKFLASAEAGEIWAKLGGFTSPNMEVDLSAYRDDITRRSARKLVASRVFRFDLSDLVPSEFGGTLGRGLFAELQDFLRKPRDIDGITKRIEASAKAAYG